VSSPTEDRRELIERLHALFEQVQADIDRRDKDLPERDTPPSSPAPPTPPAQAQA
jgi:hypothetical protein